MKPVENPEQLPLHLPLEAGTARDDLMVSSANRQAIDLLDSWPEWPGQVIILAGPVGAGKSHLAHIWAERSGAAQLKPGADLDSPPTGVRNFLLEDIVPGGFDQIWLFHLFNLVRSGNGSLLLTSRQWPGDWGITLPDLISRLKTTNLIELNEPDDDLLFGVLCKLFSDRQIDVDPKVVSYLVSRMERSLATAQKLVLEIDAQSLARKRAITKNLAADALRNLGLLE